VSIVSAASFIVNVRIFKVSARWFTKDGLLPSAASFICISARMALVYRSWEPDNETPP